MTEALHLVTTAVPTTGVLPQPTTEAPLHQVITGVLLRDTTETLPPATTEAVPQVTTGVRLQVTTEVQLRPSPALQAIQEDQEAAA